MAPVDLKGLARKVEQAHDAVHVHYSEGRGRPVQTEIRGRRELMAAVRELTLAQAQGSKVDTEAVDMAIRNIISVRSNGGNYAAARDMLIWLLCPEYEP